MKEIVKKIFSSLGLEVRRAGRAYHGELEGDLISPYHTAVLALLASRKKLHIVVVGANDGKYNDPIFDLLESRLTDCTSLTLFEPQRNLTSFLANNYAFHPDFVILNMAIGPTDILSLYAIREELWGRMQPKYAANWPIYRAPTGLTSTDRASVVAWAAEFLENDAELEGAIEHMQVPSSRLIPALLAAQRPVCVDVLQVDAEGFDDQVIYACGIEETKPALIHYESKSLESERRKALTQYLTAAGYVSCDLRFDTLCIRRESEK